jgi:F0F1-type ATP synthase delta subunit
MKLLRDNNITSQSNNTLKDFLTKLQETTIALPLLSLTIAFEPTEETLKAFSEWFLLNVKKQVLFDIAVDPTLIGGATISYNGKHVNFSIKPTFDKILQEATTIHTPSDTTNHQNIQDIHLGR